jgi:ABC-2 type transport system permease protein
MRGALVPGFPHIHPWICVVVLSAALAALMAIGVRAFYRRAID